MISKLIFRIINGVALLFTSIGFLLGFWYFYLDDRILFVFPSLAEKVSLVEILRDPDKYDERWVRVQGPVWRSKWRNAVLVSPEYEEEYWTLEEIESHFTRSGKKGFPTGAHKSIPEDHIRLKTSSKAAERNVSFYVKGIVEVLGEFKRRSVLTDESYINVGEIVEQRGNFSNWFGISLNALMFLLPFSFGIVILYIARKI